MTGAEHYAEAERLLDQLPNLMGEVARLRASTDQVSMSVSTIVSQAQVHATLAAAAATVDAALVLDEQTTHNVAQWIRVGAIR